MKMKNWQYFCGSSPDNSDRSRLLRRAEGDGGRCRQRF